MYRTLFSVLLMFAAALLLVGLTFSASHDAIPDYRFINGAEPKTLDPQLATGEPEGRIISAVFEGLTRRDPKTLEAAPGVAESWELSPDLKTYTFHLRADAKWSNGQPLIADDFVYSWKRLVEPALGSEYAYILFPVRYAEAFNAYKSYAEAIRGPLQAKVSSLVKKNQEIGAQEWQLFLADADAHGPLKFTEHAEIRDLLTIKTGRVTPEQVRAFSRALEIEAGRLLEKSAEARQKFGKNAGVYALNAHTLVVELTAPTPYFLEITSFYSTMPVPRSVIEQAGNDKDWFLPEKIVSNGPFLLSSWRVNERIRLTKSPSYWGRNEVRVQAVDALPTESATTSLNMYLTGEADWLPSNYPTDLVRDLRKRPDFYSNPGLVVYYYRFNNTKKPFTDVRVRHAFNLAIDRKLIVEQVLGLGQIPATSFVPPGMPGYQPPLSKIAKDVALAQRLLAEAGFPEGKGFPEVGILYNTMEMHKKIAEVVADQLRRNLGVQAKAYNQEWQSYISATRSQSYDIARAGWVGDYSDPNTFLDMWVTNGGNNQTGFSSPVYDQLIAFASNPDPFLANPEPLLTHLKEPENVRRELNTAKMGTGAEKAQAWGRIRMQLLREAEAILVQDEFPIMPVYFYVVSGLVKPTLRGFYSQIELPDGTRAPNLKDLHPLRDIWVERGAAQ
ncbi:MAG: peptide ABC transporter substrate-binding protein [Polyangiaceae bacterium]|nr:peptide ABC transporter substrate-binding protein [Polyangiaceae bacterium]